MNRKVINHGLWDVSRNLWNAIPIGKIDEILRNGGLKLICEDGEDFEGIFCGQRGKAEIDVMELSSKFILENKIILSWYKFETGRYEILVYLS